MASHPLLWNFFFFFLLISIAFIDRVNSEPTKDREALLTFISNVEHSKYKYNSSDSVCNWVGVSCDSKNSSVTSLHLPGAYLQGTIPVGTLDRLTRLRSLDLSGNLLYSHIPADFSNLRYLHYISLRNNNFNDHFPESLTMIPSLIHMDISFNKFTGKIPPSIGKLTRLTELFLEVNQFSGKLPNINITSLKYFNVSNNKLGGLIPKPLQRFPASSFAGNIYLCVVPSCYPSSPSLSPSSPHAPVAKTSKKIITISIIVVVVATAVPCLFLLLRLWLKKPPEEKGAGKAMPDVRDGCEENGMAKKKKLVSLDSTTELQGFGLENLLDASGQVFGEGSVGTSYKVVLGEGKTVVVKRLTKGGVVPEEEFELQMGALKKIKHSNVLPWKAFLYNTDRQLLVSEFMAEGSLSNRLHANKDSSLVLTWDERLKIALAAASGLAHLHLLGVVHGNFKSSNVLLRPDLDACISDYGIHELFTRSDAASGSLDMVETQSPTLKSDVYTYGLLLLELLTGKSPNQLVVLDLPSWVQSAVTEERTTDVLDGELVKHGIWEEDMVKLLQIAVACVSDPPQLRPSMKDVVISVEKIEKNRRGEASDSLSKDNSVRTF